MANVVITTHWTDGDVIPFVRIGRTLKRRGHSVTLITHCFYERMAREAGLDFAAWDSPDQYAQMIHDMGSYSDTVAGAEEIHRFREKYESIDVRLKELEIVQRYCQKENSILLAKNRSSIAALMASEIHQCPLILFFMNPYETGSMVNFESLYKERLKNEVNQLRRRVGLLPIDGWLSWQSSPKIQLALWPKWFSNELSEWPGTIEPIGFPLERRQDVLARDNQEFLKYVRDDPAPIIISGGTSKQIRQDFYIKAIEACGLLGRKTIVVTRYKELLPHTLPPNITWFSHLPLDAVLPHMGAIIHHGGIGTTSGAVYAAVPQLALACYVDRPLNASRIKSLGVGEYLPPSRWDPILIANTLKKLLEPDYKARCHQFLKEIPADDALTEVCDRVEAYAGNKDYAISHAYMAENSGAEALSTQRPKDTSSVRPNLSSEVWAYLMSRKKNRS
jgi:UDP:flavonoid glycosyltransferase YjiC (YdhE family)